MRSYAVSTTQGLIRPGQYDSIWTPGITQRDPSKLPCVLVHGSGQPVGYTYALNVGSVSLAANLAALGGIPCMASENDDQAWGNDQALADIDAQITYLASKFGTPAGKAVLVGGSMGGYTALRYAMVNPSKVAAVVGVIPLTDIKWFYNYWGTTGTGITTAAQIASAWGVAAPISVPDMSFTATSTAVTSASNAFTSAMNGQIVFSPGYSPLGTTFTYVDAGHGTLSAPATTTGTNGSYTSSMLTPLPTRADIQSIANTLTVPTRFYYSSADALVNPTQQVAFATAAHITANNVGANGHSEQTILDAQNWNGSRGSDIISFLQQNGS